MGGLRGWSRRGAISLMAGAALSLPMRASGAARLVRRGAGEARPANDYKLYHEALGAILPWAGYSSSIALKDSIVRLIAAGVIDLEKYLSFKGGEANFSKAWLAMLHEPTEDPIHLSSDNAAEFVDILWPVGLANRLAANAEGSIGGPDVDTLASTGGWGLGHAESGGQYFNAEDIVDLTDEQAELAVRVAKSTFRPCCDNSTFFQDCNHGSALFGVLQLGAAQGLDEAELYREALAFNSFWFPGTYVVTALYFKVVKHTEWHEVDPRVVMGEQFSTASGWTNNVAMPLQAYPDLLPPPSDGVNCGA